MAQKKFDLEKPVQAKTKWRWWQVAGSAGLFSLGLIIGAGLFVWTHLQTAIVSAEQPDQPVQVNTSPTPTPDPLAPYAIAVLGYGGPNHQGGNLTDTMMAAYIQPRDKKVTLISIPRDLWVNLPISEEGLETKINAAFAIGNDDRQYTNKPTQYTGEAGGGELTKDILETVTGLEFKHFIAVSFSGFSQAIDQLGGVEVKVPVAFEDKFYPVAGKEDETCDKSEEEITSLSATMSGYLLEQQFPCRYETLTFEAGKQIMDGETALKFVRSRHSETYGNDFNRSQRQQALIVGLKSKIFSFNTLPKLPGLIANLSSYVLTDIDQGQILELLKVYGDISEYEVSTLILDDDNVLVDARSKDRQYILVPKTGPDDWESIHTYLIQELHTSED